jgi:hypothetical protein
MFCLAYFSFSFHILTLLQILAKKTLRAVVFSKLLSLGTANDTTAYEKNVPVFQVYSVPCYVHATANFFK